jgi:hypothetical protein
VGIYAASVWRGGEGMTLIELHNLLGNMIEARPEISILPVEAEGVYCNYIVEVVTVEEEGTEYAHVLLREGVSDERSRG